MTLDERNEWKLDVVRRVLKLVGSEISELPFRIAYSRERTELGFEAIALALIAVAKVRGLSLDEFSSRLAKHWNDVATIEEIVDDGFDA